MNPPNELTQTTFMNFNYINNESQQQQRPNIFGSEYKPIEWTQTTPQQMPWAQSPSHYSDVMTFGSANFFQTPLQNNVPSPPVQQQEFQFNVPSTSSNCNNLAQNSRRGMDQHRQLNPNYRFGNTLHCKRKSDVINIPSKQHITEERMAHHMSNLHISSETPLSTELGQVDDTEATAEREKRLVLCEEMRKLQTESIIPSAIMRRLERPCMAVMLWQPPDKVTRHNLAAIMNSSTSDQVSERTETHVDNNNADNVEDLNGSDDGDMDMDL